MSVIYGRISKRLLGFYDPGSSSWKMYEDTLPLDFEKSSVILPVSGMTLAGHLYALRTPERHIVEKDYLSLPTPLVSGQGNVPTESRRRFWNVETVLLNIPTPTASDSHWSESTAERKGIKGNHNLSLVSWSRLSTIKKYRLHWIKVN